MDGNKVIRNRARLTEKYAESKLIYTAFAYIHSAERIAMIWAPVGVFSC